jgi:hypothetical protein
VTGSQWDGEPVRLPGGLALENGSWIEEVGLRSLTGREELWLARHDGVPSAAAVTFLLGACLDPERELPFARDLARRLLVGDREYVMVQLRRRTLGDTIAAVTTCPSCAAQMDITLDLAEIPIEGQRQQAVVHQLRLDNRARPTAFRLPTGADQEAVIGRTESDAVETLFSRCLLDDGGRPLTPNERETVIAEMERIAPRVEIELDLTCPECGQTFSIPFDTIPFFFAEMRANSRFLLREVHHLAFHYHWSEGDILGLDRARRRDYLSLLSDELRRE